MTSTASPTQTEGRRANYSVSLALAALAFTVAACRNAPTPPDIVDLMPWTHRAIVEGSVTSLSGLGIGSASVSVRVKANTPHGMYPVAHSTSAADGHFVHAVYRVPFDVPLDIVGPDTVRAFVIAASEPRGSNGLLPVDSVPVLLRFTPRGTEPPDTAHVTVKVPVPER